MHYTLTLPSFPQHPSPLPPSPSLSLPLSPAVQLHRGVEVGEVVGELQERVQELEKHNTTLKNKVTLNTPSCNLWYLL